MIAFRTVQNALKKYDQNVYNFHIFIGDSTIVKFLD